MTTKERIEKLEQKNAKLEDKCSELQLQITALDHDLQATKREMNK